MAYDPFARGPFPAGVRTQGLTDAARGDRPCTVEVWYPAEDAHAGQDVADPTRDRYELIPGFPAMPQDAVRDARPRAGRYPLVAFSHGFAGHRRQSTFLCTHLASHGYVVVATDHAGNTVLDAIHAMTGGVREDPFTMFQGLIANRPGDVRFVLDQVLAGAVDGVAGLVDAERIGMAGHSFGGWTTLAVTGADRRIRAALPLAPAGGATALGSEILGPVLDFAWGRDVPTLFVVADQDNVLVLPGMHDLYARTRASKRMVVMKDTDHLHFCDNVEQSHEMFRTMPIDPGFAQVVKGMRPIGELVSGAQSQDAIRGLGLAHMDAVLREHEGAAAFLAGDVAGVLAARGLRVEAA